jgi:ubiquitin-protein ligase E3 C
MSFIPGLHSFDGNSNRQKKIDLSGNKRTTSNGVGLRTSTRSDENASRMRASGFGSGGSDNGRNLTKEETLLQAKRERERRYRARVELKAALVFQKHWRSAKALRLAKERMRAEEEKMERDRDDGSDVCIECSSLGCGACSCAAFGHLRRLTFYASSSSSAVPSGDDDEERMDEDGTMNVSRDDVVRIRSVRDMEAMSKVLRALLPAWVDGEKAESVDEAKRRIRRRILARALRWCLRRLSETIDDFERELSGGDEYGTAINSVSKRTLAELTCEYLLGYGDASDALIRGVAKDEWRNVKGAVSFTNDIVKNLVRNRADGIFAERALFTLISEIGRVALEDADRRRREEEEEEEDAMDVGLSSEPTTRCWGESFAIQVFTCPLVFRKLLSHHTESEDSLLSSSDARFFAPTATLFLRAFSTPSDDLLDGHVGEEGYSRIAWSLGNICEWSRTPEFGVGCKEGLANSFENALLFANACGVLVDALPLSALPVEDENHYSSSFSRNDNGRSTLFDSDDEEFNEKSLRPTKGSLAKKGGCVFDTVEMPPLLKRQLASLWNPPSSILSSQLARACAVDLDKEEGDMREKNTAKIAKYILGISSVLRGKDRVYFLASFAFQCADIMRNLWLSVSRQYAKNPKDTIRDPKWREQLGAFSEIYAVHAQTADDEEFYVIGKPLTIDESKFLVEIAKNTLWFQLWEDPFSNSGGSNGSNNNRTMRTEDCQIEATASVLQNLFDRNGRRQFAPPELFYAVELCGGVDSGFLTPAVESFLREFGEGGRKSRASNVLNKCSCLAPFEVRVRAFGTATEKFRREEIGMSAMNARNSEASWLMNSMQHSKMHITVERGKVLRQGFKQLFLDQASSSHPSIAMRKCVEALQGNVRVKFINEHGAEEAGVDGGGLFKDFLSATVEEAFDPKEGNFLFCETPDRTLYPNPRYANALEKQFSEAGNEGDEIMVTYDSNEEGDRERWLVYSYFYLGAILGKACGEGILLDAPLAGFFLSKLRGKPPALSDLTTFDPEVYRNLIMLKGFNESDFDNLELYFVALDRSNANPESPRYVDLVPNGSNIRVNKKNYPSYLHAMATYLLDGQIRMQSAAFVEGFRAMVRPSTLKLFTPAELGLLISGSGGGVDVDDLARSSHYMGGYDADHPVIQRLWRVTRNMSKENQRKLLKFVTSSANTPLLGFSALNPPFCIHRAASGSDANSVADVTRLPSAATCMNLLKLPPYDTDEEMEKKLVYAISNAKAFDLS